MLRVPLAVDLAQVGGEGCAVSRNGKAGVFAPLHERTGDHAPLAEECWSASSQCYLHSCA